MSRLPKPRASLPPSRGSRISVPQTRRGSATQLRPGEAEMRAVETQISRPTPTGTEIIKTSRLTGNPVLPAKPSTIKRRPSAIQAVPALQKQVFTQALAKSAAVPGKVSKTSGVKQSVVRAPVIKTKRGKEQVLQQMVMEKTVQRSPKAEYVSKYIKAIDSDPSGRARQIEMTTQQIDPTHGTENLGVNQTVSVTSSLSITAKGKQETKKIKKSTLKVDKFLDQINMNPDHINRLIIEEIEDVDNTLKMVPPDIVSTSVQRMPLQKKLHSLRLNSESLGLLQQSLINPIPTADEVEGEAAPEAMASIINAMEKGASPQAAPNQIFNTLFPDVKEERLDVSSVAPGPLQDIVIPTEAPKQINEEVLTDEMERTVTHVSAVVELPKDDICTESKIAAPQRTSKAKKKLPVLLKDETPPWATEDVTLVSKLVGAQPIYNVKAADVTKLNTSKAFNDELSNGIDYYLDADTVPFETKVQLRGTRLPNWFPGYMAVFPHLPGLIEVSKCPNKVMHSAWKAVQPKIFPEDSIIIA